MADLPLTDRLCSASASGNLPEVLFLLQNGADVNGSNRYGRTPLQVAKLGCVRVVEALLAAGASPNVRDPVLGLTVSHDAARDGWVHALRSLMEHGANPNLADDRGNLPLHLAASQGRLEAVQLLMGPTEDPRARNGQGRTAAQLALLHGQTDTAKYIDESLSPAH